MDLQIDKKSALKNIEKQSDRKPAAAIYTNMTFSLPAEMKNRMKIALINEQFANITSQNSLVEMAINQFLDSKQ